MELILLTKLSGIHIKLFQEELGCSQAFDTSDIGNLSLLLVLNNIRSQILCSSQIKSVFI